METKKVDKCIKEIFSAVAKEATKELKQMKKMKQPKQVAGYYENRILEILELEAPGILLALITIKTGRVKNLNYVLSSVIQTFKGL